MFTTSRRAALRLLASFGFVSVLPQGARAAIATPGATEGPYYPKPSMRFPDQDADLVRIAGAVKDAGGEIIHLRGQVLDRSGVPVVGARVEIWQCDVNGRYIHTSDRNRADPDPSFQGFGHSVTDQAGAYAFRTIKPVSYPGRTPHIHVKVFHPGGELTSQFYIKDHPENARDGIYRRLSDAERAAVDMAFVEGADGREATLNIIV